MVATPDQKDLLLTYLITGARKSEILKWQWPDIDFKNRIYALHTRKSGTKEQTDFLADFWSRKIKKPDKSSTKPSASQKKKD